MNTYKFFKNKYLTEMTAFVLHEGFDDLRIELFKDKTNTWNINWFSGTGNADFANEFLALMEEAIKLCDELNELEEQK